MRRLLEIALKLVSSLFYSNINYMFDNEPQVVSAVMPYYSKSRTNAILIIDPHGHLPMLFFYALACQHIQLSVVLWQHHIFQMIDV